MGYWKGCDSRYCGKRTIKQALLIGLLFFLLPVFAAGAPGAEKNLQTAVGVFLGNSHSLGDKFIDVTSGGHTDNHYKPNFFFGAFFQVDLSPSFGLQLSVNSQRFVNSWKFHYWDRQEYGKDSSYAFALNLYGFFNLNNTAITRIYLLGGGGLLSGSFENLDDLWQLGGGGGARFRLKRGSPFSLDLAAIIHLLFVDYSQTSKPVYLKLRAGITWDPGGNRI